MSKTLKITNADVFTNGKFEKTDVYIVDGKISFTEIQVQKTLDAGGKMLIPGFIDIHIHGALGCDFNDGTHEAFDKITQFVASHGTTSLLATTSTVSVEAVKNAAKTTKNKMNGITNGAQVLGLHMEGPFLNPSALGAQNPDFVKKPSAEALDGILEECSDVLKLITVAPECEGAVEFIKEMKKRNVSVAIGHTTATYDETVQAFEAGADMLTHFYNTMTPLKHRDPGVVGATFENGNVNIQLICDLIHVHAAAIKIAIKNMGIKNTVLISDAMSGTGLGDGIYSLGGLDVYVENGVARIKEGNLAGSTLTLDVAMKNMLSLGYTMADVVSFLSENPARAIGVDNRKGYIKEGFDADILIIDENFDVVQTFVNGRQMI